MKNIKFNAYVDDMRVNNPGIGRYKLEDETLIRTSRAPAFSMGHKTKPSDLRKTIDPQNQNPSPAAYENNPEKSSTLYASHFKKTGFVFSSSERFKNSSTYYLRQTASCQLQEITRTQQVCRVWESTWYRTKKAAQRQNLTKRRDSQNLMRR